MDIYEANVENARNMHNFGVKAPWKTKNVWQGDINGLKHGSYLRLCSKNRLQ